MIGLVYLIIRLYLAYAWLSQGLAKLGDPEWMVTGKALLTFWEKGVVVPRPPAWPLITFGWYRAFIQTLIDARCHPWLAPVFVYVQLLTGLALLLGCWTRASALAGLVQNLNFSLAGGRGHNPFMLMAETALLLAPTEPGRLGLDGLLHRRNSAPD